MAESCAPGRFFKLLDKNIAIMADEKYEKTEDVQQTEEAAAEAQNPTEAETTEKTDAEKLAEAEEEIARLKDRYLRQAAEFDNFRKRTLKEKSELLLNGGEKVIASLLPVLDDLERAMDNMEKSTDVATLREGVELIVSKLQKTLATHGLKKIETEGKDFDTDFHEAVALVPADEEAKKNKIIDCVQPGYMLNEKVIRHSKVVVGQ